MQTEGASTDGSNAFLGFVQAPCKTNDPCTDTCLCPADTHACTKGTCKVRSRGNLPRAGLYNL